MGRIVFVGGGIVGTCAAMMLANDGHDVTVLERDPTPPPPPDTAWDEWDRRGVNQFRMLHFLLPRFREVAEAELPGLTEAMVAAGALKMNPLAGIPDELTGGWRETDSRFDTVTARRPGRRVGRGCPCRGDAGGHDPPRRRRGGRTQHDWLRRRGACHRRAHRGRRRRSRRPRRRCGWTAFGDAELAARRGLTGSRTR